MRIQRLMNKPQTTDQAITAEVDDLLNEWRAKAITIVFFVSSIAAIPSLIAVFSERIFHLSWPYRLACLLLLAALVTATLMRQWPLRRRVGIILATIGIFAALQLTVTQLSGSGRLSLMSLPLIALIFLGPRWGWWTMGGSLILFFVWAFLAQTDVLSRLGSVDGVGTSTTIWFLQGLRLAGEMTMLMLLLTQLMDLQRRTMIAERSALRNLELATAERQSLEAEIARVSETERRHLGSELHDGLCQNLTAALLHCTALENRLKDQESPHAPGVGRIREIIEESIDLARDVARGLSHLDLDAEGLPAALDELCQLQSKRHGLSYQLRLGEKVVIANGDVALHLFRIAGEALSNAAKHAGGTRLEIELYRDEKDLVLLVKDDGKGMGSEVKKGMGLPIMKHRAKLMGGALTLTSFPGQGTMVTCRVPYEKVAG